MQYAVLRVAVVFLYWVHECFTRWDCHTHPSSCNADLFADVVAFEFYCGHHQIQWCPLMKLINYWWSIECTVRVRDYLSYIFKYKIHVFFSIIRLFCCAIQQSAIKSILIFTLSSFVCAFEISLSFINKHTFKEIYSLTNNIAVCGRLVNKCYKLSIINLIPLISISPRYIKFRLFAKVWSDASTISLTPVGIIDGSTINFTPVLLTTLKRLT